MKLARSVTGRRQPPPQQPSAWTPEAIRRLGATTDVETAAAILGIGRTKAYELAKSGDFPVPLVRIGRRYLVPVGHLLRLLGVEHTAPRP